MSIISFDKFIEQLETLLPEFRTYIYIINFLENIITNIFLHCQLINKLCL